MWPATVRSWPKILFKVFHIFEHLNYCLFHNACSVNFLCTGKLHKVVENDMLASLNKWKQQEIYLENFNG
jgi:hypothetical protein